MGAAASIACRDDRRHAGHCRSSCRIVALAQRSRTLAALAAQIAANKEAQQQKKMAEKNFQLARDAVDRYFTHVSENELLEHPSLQSFARNSGTLPRVYEVFVRKRGNEPDLQFELADAYDRIGRMTRELGPIGDSIAAHTRALRVREPHTSELATRPDYQLSQGLSYLYLSRSQHVAGMTQQAVTSLNKAAGIIENLTERQPHSRQHVGWLAMVYVDVGNLRLEMGRKGDAIVSYQRALGIIEKLVKQHPDSRTHHHQLALVYAHLSIALQGKVGHAGKSLSLLRKASKYRNGSVPKPGNRSSNEVPWRNT